MGLYEAMYEAIAEREGVDPGAVAKALTHRVFLDDGFWAAWDDAIAEGAALFRYVTKEA